MEPSVSYEDLVNVVSISFGLTKIYKLYYKTVYSFWKVFDENELINIEGLLITEQEKIILFICIFSESIMKNHNMKVTE